MTARQFDVCRVVGGRIDSAVDLALVLQHDNMSDLVTRVVAPLIPVGNRYDVERTTPVVDVDGKEYVVAMHLITTVPRRNLQPIATLAKVEEKLKNATDAVFFGL